MNLSDIDTLAASLPGCKRKGTEERPAWYVHNRLVARLSDPTTLVIRVPLEAREAFLEAHPGGFGVPPRFEMHHKIEAYLDRADPAAVREAIRLAWEFQRQ